jgi:hypothetical protein
MTNETTHQHHPQTTSAYPEAFTDLVADYDPASISADVLLDQESANDRHDNPSDRNLLLHQAGGRADGRTGLLCPSGRLSGAGTDGRRSDGGVQAEAGQAEGEESSSNGRDGVGSVADHISSVFPTQTDEVFKPEEHAEAIKRELDPKSRWQRFRAYDDYMPQTNYEAAVYLQSAYLHLRPFPEAFAARAILIAAHGRINDSIVAEVCR